MLPRSYGGQQPSTESLIAGEPNPDMPGFGLYKEGTDMKRHIAVTLLAGLLLASAAAAAPPINGGFGCFGPTVGIGDFSGLDNALAAGGITQKLGSLQ